MALFHKILCSFLLLLFLPEIGKATHNRAGEITYRYISGYTFEFTVSTYTFTGTNVDRDALEVSWGDGVGPPQLVPRTSSVLLPNQYKFNTYTIQHTFPGPGTYQILMQDPNRNDGVKNIPNSVNTIFSIKTIMLIGPFVGTNSTPVLLNPPIDNAARNHVFIHNPAAYDADGDSLSYELTVCTEENGNPIENYEFPPASDTLFMNEVIGDLNWITPTEIGTYNIAIFIDEWRDNVKIGRITRDMQIDVYDTDNTPPVNGPIIDYCVEAGDTIEFFVTTTDQDNDPIKQEIIGIEPFGNNSNFEVIEMSPGSTTSKFTLITNCDQARQQPYTLILKSQDQVNEVSLVDISSFFITIIPNAPKNLIADPGTDLVNLIWDKSECGIPRGYRIYRRIGAFNFIPDSCENGVPSYTGYELIGEVMGANTTSFKDNNDGKGLVPGFEYCYMITAFYSDGAESFASEEVCTSLIPGVPSMLEVSVLSDNSTTGEISVKWAAPRNFDTVDDGPYRYEIYRMAPNETEYSLVQSIPTIDLTDTSFIDKNINTLEFPYFYSARIVYQDGSNDWIVHPGYESASSLYLNLTGRDNEITVEMLKRAPWVNSSFDIFRKAELATSFDSIARATSDIYVDAGLANQVPYTYRAKSNGFRPLNGVPYSIRNTSHISTTEAVDTVVPCAPLPSVTSICDSAYNLVTWESPKSICGNNDIVNYKLYYSPLLDQDPDLIETLPASDTSFIHRIGTESLAAIYGIAAVDSFNNVSKINFVSVDSCLMYSLPNVFSPGGDRINDIYVSFNLGGSIKEVDMTIYNRYGQLVYKTSDPDINWDGYHKDTKQLVSTGVYYYVCDFYEPRITGKVQRTLKGFIHVFSGSSNNQFAE